MKTIETTIFTRPDSTPKVTWFKLSEEQRAARNHMNVAIGYTLTSPTTQLEVIYFNTEEAMAQWKAKPEAQAVLAARDAYNAANGIIASATTSVTVE